MHAKFPDLAGRFLDRYGQAYALPRFMRYNGLNLDRSHSQRTTLYYSLRRDGIFLDASRRNPDRSSTVELWEVRTRASTSH